MRPALLNPLFAPVTSLPGIGDKTARLLHRLLESDRDDLIVDLLFHLPHTAVDRRLRPKIADAPNDRVVTIEATVCEHRPPGRRSHAPYRVLVEDETGNCLLIFFRDNHRFIEQNLPLGERRLISGKMELWEGKRQIVHPDYVLRLADAEKLPTVEPVYRLTDGLFAKNILRLMDSALEVVPKRLPEWHDSSLVQARKNWPDFITALINLHRPDSLSVLDVNSLARQRLAYDELLAQQLQLALVRQQLKRPKGQELVGDGSKTNAICDQLPYRLTRAQMAALADIRADMVSPLQMVRLLQGDVGAGKTIVALLAMAQAVEAGKQAVLMAPTEILARQHFEKLGPLCSCANIRYALITGKDKTFERAKVLAELKEGAIDVVFGTHALFQQTVVFKNLALAVIDEQHRFGVEQRLALSAKGEGVDVLVMTATPIPRTLVLSHFGDMDVSILNEKPLGRQKIDTRLIAINRLEEVIVAIGRALVQNNRVYWICPLVSESELLDLAAAEERFEALRHHFGDKVLLVHGKMASGDKDAAMEKFRLGEAQILVATTVVEVGVDVPEATIMIIEHAERFGLAQLHQLRGRVGRGTKASVCLLLYKPPLGTIAQRRLSVMRQSDDGFVLAEEDLRLRGEGDILGTKQSGLPSYKMADLVYHGDLLAMARDDAKLILINDPELVSDRGQALRLLLYIFSKSDAMRVLRSG